MMKLLVLVVISVVANAQGCSDQQGESACKHWAEKYNFCKRIDAKKYCNKTCGGCSTKSCGVSKVSQGRVVNGVNAQPGAWPWIASLQNNGGHWCGATLISTKWVLTASHCVSRITPSNMRRWTIKLGAHNHRNTESSVQKRNIKRVIMHPRYGKDGSISNDVALIELDTPAILNDRVVLGCLPKKGVYPVAGKQCYIAGWGAVNHPGGVYHTLQQAKLPVVARGHKGCHNNKDVVCVGLGFGKQPDGKQHPNACRGDSGGPLVCQKPDGNWQLEGVASYVYTYCKFYTAYAPVNKYIDWISSYVK